MVSGIGIVTCLEKVHYEKKDKSGFVDGVLVHCVVYDDDMVKMREDACQSIFEAENNLEKTNALVDLNFALLNCRVCRCWCSNKPNSIVNGLAIGDKVEIRFGKYGEYITGWWIKMDKYTFIFGPNDKRIMICVVASSLDNAKALVIHYLNDEGKKHLPVATVKAKDILK